MNIPSALGLFLGLPLFWSPDHRSQDETVADVGLSGAAPSLPEIAITPHKAEYRDLNATLALFDRWVAARPERVSLVPLGTSAGGRPITALRIAAPGVIPAAARKTLLLVGGLDGISLHGSEEVLAIAASLAAVPNQLPSDLAFLCLPWASPDGLSAEYKSLSALGVSTFGRDETVIDDDLDGQSGEDPAEDIDGDGRVTMMLVEDPNGAWQRAPDGRFLLPSGSELGKGPRYGLFREGQDDDHDGLFNEDGIGGVQADRNFPVGWLGPSALASPGKLPLSSPPASALAQLARAGNLVGALFFDGHSGRCEGSDGLKMGPLEQISGDLFAAGVSKYAESTVVPIRFAASVGSAIDWFPRVGVPAVRLSFWGAEIGLGRGQVKTASFHSGDFVPPSDMLEDFCSPDSASESGGWSRFLDERRGGIGFIDWHPVELESGRSVLVGGWEPAVLRNPPEEQLAHSVALAVDLMGGLIAALPKVRVEIVDVRREGELCTLTARLQTSVGQGGALPVDFLAPGGFELVLDLPPGARLIAGPLRGPIKAEALSGAPIEWLIFAPDDALLSLRVLRSFDDAEVDRREVRP